MSRLIQLLRIGPQDLTVGTLSPANVTVVATVTDVRYISMFFAPCVVLSFFLRFWCSLNHFCY